MSTDFPVADSNRFIREAAEGLLMARKPGRWHLQSMGGENDFGLDYLVQVSSQGRGVVTAFYIQLKGTERLDLVNGDAEIAYPLKRTTLNYYASLPQDTMLVICDVKVDEDGALDLSASQAYWEWSSNIIRSRRRSPFALDESNAKTSTVRLPTNKVLSRSLDVEPHLNARLAQLSAGASLEEILAASTSGFEKMDSVSPLARLVDSARLNPNAFLSLVVGRLDAVAFDMPPAALVVRTQLRSGQTEIAARELDRLGSDGFGLSAPHRAWWLSLKGKAETQRGDRVKALEYFDAAHAQVQSEEHMLPRAELRFLREVDRGATDKIAVVRDELAAVISEDGLALRVRVHVALREFDEAKNCVERMSGEHRAMSELVIASGLRDWQTVIDGARRALDDPRLAVNERSGIELVAMRAAWFLAIDGAPLSEDGQVPLTGAFGTDVNAAQLAWSFAKQCAASLRSIGWPPNVELMAPIFCAAAGTVGAHAEALVILQDASETRPEYVELQHSLELLAIGGGDAEIALAANLRQPDSDDVLIRRCAILFQLQKFSDCLTSSLKVLHAATSSREAPMALSMGYASARKLARSEDAALIREALSTHPDADQYLAFAEFARESVVSPKNNDGLDRLRAGLSASPGSQILAANLLSNLEVDDPAQAEEALGLVRLLRARALLSRRDVIQELYALTTLQRWDDAADAATRAIARFGSDQTLLSLLAVAEEMRGRTSDALEALETAMSAGADRLAILHNYMGIAIRLGRLDCVGHTIDRLLAIETSRKERLEFFRLRTLIHLQLAEPEKAMRLLEEIADIADREIEDEEGTFLNLAMVITVQGHDLPADMAAKFQVRAGAFFDRWPISVHFRRVDVPVSEGDFSIHDLLDPVLGDSRARLAEFKTLERQLKNSEVLVPFIARPGYALHYVSNAFDLWILSKRSQFEDRQLHLQSDLATPSDDLPRRDPTRDIPLLDLTALLLLESLGLFEALFSVFRRIAIPRLTVAYVSEHANSVLGGGPGSEIAKSILAQINAWLPRIDQPGTDRTIHRHVTASGVLLDYMQLAKSKGETIYCDDGTVRAALRLEGVSTPGMTTTDFLRLLDGDNLSPGAVAIHLSHLVRWNVGINIANRYLIASLEGAIPPDNSISAMQRLYLIEQHEPFTTLLRALTDPSFPPARLVQHMGELLETMLAKAETQVESVAAVLAFWFRRVRFFKIAGQLSWRLLGYPVTFALNRLPEPTARKVIGTLQQAIEALFGDSNETARIEAEMPILLGQIAGSLAARNKQLGDSVLARISLAMPLGTLAGDAAFESYVKAVNEAESNAPRHMGR